MSLQRSEAGLDVRQLRYFVRIIETRSFTKAAEQLHIAQPALGLQIRKLEEELGVKLMIRHSRGIEPTEAGELLCAEARDILGRITETARRVRDMSGSPRGRLAIGMVPSAGFVLSGKLVKRMAEALPEIAINLVEEVSQVLMEWVEEDRLDLCLAYKMRDSTALAFEPLLVEEIYFVTSPGAAGARPGPISLSEVASYPLVMPGVPHGLRQLVEDEAGPRKLALDIRFEMQSVAAARELVEQGIASTLLPLGAVRREVRDGRLVARRIVEPRIARTLYLVTAARRPPSRAVDAVCSILRSLIAEELAQESGGWSPAEAGKDRPGAIQPRPPASLGSGAAQSERRSNS
jgi:LysR family nitrogen assimilation transcriptional regulator